MFLSIKSNTVQKRPSKGPSETQHKGNSLFVENSNIKVSDMDMLSQAQRAKDEPKWL